ncbi:MAG: M48 family metalloprotease [Planctomycetes bacterium]|nr:M48 family metalloprotease [Planctomycetota bacterium]
MATKTKLDELTLDAVLCALPTPAPSKGPSALYKLSLGLVALAMVILPVLYVGLIVVVGMGWYNWIWHGLDYLGWHPTSDDSSGRLGIMIYAIVLITGPVLVAFLLKPLLARKPKREEPLSLDKEDEPVLFALVDRICELQGAPTPSRIDVDLQMNASAGFRLGMRSFFSSDLVLTIGLPLAACMDARQLTSVLCHEFGHFTQAFGMRAYYLVATINQWFARVVYERDRWDVTIRDLSKSGWWQVAIIMNGVRGLVGLSRWILKGFMLFGNALTGLLSRQMEFDADGYAVRMVGPECFEATMKSLILASHAEQSAFHDVDVSLEQGSFPDNFPYLVAKNLMAFPEEASDEAWAQGKDSTVDMYASHPPMVQRVQNAFAVEEPGQFSLDAPAKDLFQHWKSYCTELTQDWYTGWEGPKFDAERLVSSKAAFEAGNQVAALRRNQVAVFGTGLSAPLVLDGIQLEDVVQAPTQAEYEQAREAFRQALDKGHELGQAYWKRFERLPKFDFALRLYESGMRDIINAMELSTRTISTTRAKSEQMHEEQQELLRSAQALNPLFTPRLIGALGLAEDNQLAKPDLAEHAASLRKALAEQVQLAKIAVTIEACRVPLQVTDNLHSVVRSEDKNASPHAKKAYRSAAVMLLTKVQEAEEAAKSLPEMSREPYAFLFPNGVTHSAKPDEFIECAGQLITRYSDWNSQILGSMATAILAIEGSLGWEPITAPFELAEDTAQG